MNPVDARPKVVVEIDACQHATYSGLGQRILLRGNGRNNLFGKHVSICPFNQIGIEVPNTQCRTPISRASEHKRGNVADISGVEKAEPDAVVRHIRPCRQQTLFCRSCKIWHYSPGQRITLLGCSSMFHFLFWSRRTKKETLRSSECCRRLAVHGTQDSAFPVYTSPRNQKFPRPI